MKKPLSKKAKIVIISSVAAFVVLALVLSLSLYFTVGAANIIDLDIEVSQIDDTQSINVKWDTAANVDEIIITVKNSSKETVSQVTLATPSAVMKKSAQIETHYGKMSVEVTAKRKSLSTKQTASINLFADEYVIAPLVATMPVTFFSLSLKDYSNDYTIPTFVWLERGGAWDYSNMHENVYLIPNLSFDRDALYTDIYDLYDGASEWIKELYEINPSSKFHLYYNDYHPWGWMQATVANGIPSENYDVTLLSDGTGSYYAFSYYLNRENSDELFTAMCADYRKLKSQIADKGAYKKNDNKLAINTQQLRNYVFCMLTEEQNVKLVLARDFITNDMPKDNPMRPTFLELISNADAPDRPIQIRSMYSLLTAMSEQEKADLQRLYKFSDNMFEKAVQENKKVMVFLGTRTDYEIDFDSYVKATMAYYGDEYVYYYKGHPGTATQMDPDKGKRLEALGLIDIDSTIAAELIFFFNQEACASGYGSSTYNSLLDDQVCGVWNTALSGVNSEYKDKVDFTIRTLGADDAVYGSLASGSCFLFEFADKTKYDAAVYYKDQNAIKYYKLSGDGFVEVSK